MKNNKTLFIIIGAVVGVMLLAGAAVGAFLLLNSSGGYQGDWKLVEGSEDEFPGSLKMNDGVLEMSQNIGDDEASISLSIKADYEEKEQEGDRYSFTVSNVELEYEGDGSDLITEEQIDELEKQMEEDSEDDPLVLEVDGDQLKYVLRDKEGVYEKE